MSEGKSESHPLTDCDPDECYRTMMSERTDLIKAQRDAEDTLVKTIIQISSALLVLLAGFVVQSDSVMRPFSQSIYLFCMFGLVVAVVAGLFEHFFSSKAYSAQLKLVESFYTQQISSFGEPIENKWVRAMQRLQFGAFAIAAFFLLIIAAAEIGEKDDQGKEDGTTSTSTSTATATSAATATAAAASSSSSSSSSSFSYAGVSSGRPKPREGYPFGGTANASTAA